MRVGVNSKLFENIQIPENLWCGCGFYVMFVTFHYFIFRIDPETEDFLVSFDLSERELISP